MRDFRVRDILREAKHCASRARQRRLLSGHSLILEHQGSTIADYLALVIAYRDHALVYGVLARLAQQTVLPQRVLVVDNGGTLTEDDLVKMPLADRTKLITRPENPGYGAAVNEARSQLGDHALLVLTHDAMFGNTLAERLLAGFASPPQVGSVGPVLHFVSQPDRLFSAGGRISRGGRAHPWLNIRSDQPYAVDWVDGAIVMFSPTALDAIGWIDEGYFLYFEDVDTGWRLNQAGFTNLIVPTEIAYQEPGGHPMYLGIRNMALFSKKANIAALPAFAAMLYRAGRESIGRLRRGKKVLISEIWHGWRDGRAGISGKPVR